MINGWSRCLVSHIPIPKMRNFWLHNLQVIRCFPSQCEKGNPLSMLRYFVTSFYTVEPVVRILSLELKSSIEGHITLTNGWLPDVSSVLYSNTSNAKSLVT